MLADPVTDLLAGVALIAETDVDVGGSHLAAGWVRTICFAFDNLHTHARTHFSKAFG